MLVAAAPLRLAAAGVSRPSAVPLSAAQGGRRPGRRPGASCAACPVDPGRLWLDCTVDALGPETAGDPLDCVPSAADEAAFDGQLAARRGLPLRDQPAGAAAASRSTAPGAPRWRPRSRACSPPSLALRSATEGHCPPSVAEPAAQLPPAIHARRRRPPAGPSGSRSTTSWTVLELGETARSPCDLLGLGLPLRTARFVPVSADGADITFDRHGFTLRLGSAARLALRTRHRWPAAGTRPTPPPSSTGVFAAASYLDRAPPAGLRGPGGAGLPAGGRRRRAAWSRLHRRACAALGRRLRAVFAALDGGDLDLFLEGCAPLVERDGDGRADSLRLLCPPRPGSRRAGYLRTHATSSTVSSGSFTAIRPSGARRQQALPASCCATRALVGATLAEIADGLGLPVPIGHVRTKGWSGQIIERELGRRRPAASGARTSPRWASSSRPCR